MHTWKRNVISDLFAMLLELLRIIPSDLQMVHHLIVICLILMTISLMCWRKYVYSCCFQLLDLKACYKRDIAKQTFYLGCRSIITEIFKLSFIKSVFRTVA